jgi:hypothetical protein
VYYYSAFQLSITSEIEIPELSISKPLDHNNASHVHIQLGKVNYPTNSSNIFYHITKNNFWLNIPNIAKFLVQNGNSITIDPMPEIDADSIRVFLLKTCFGILLTQRNTLVLHGSVIKIDQHCFACLGTSVAGKSAIAAEFFKRGYQILTENLCAINALGYVIPSFPQISLWLDTLQHLQIDNSTLKRIRPSLEKFAVPLNKQFYPEPVLLKNIFILKTHNKDNIYTDSIQGAQKIKALKDNTYREQYNINSTQHNFQQYVSIARQTNITKIIRPQHEFSLHKLADLITEKLNALETCDAE